MSRKWVVGSLLLLCLLTIAVRGVQLLSETEWMCAPLAENAEFRSMSWLEDHQWKQPLLSLVRPQEQMFVTALTDTFSKEIQCFPVIGSCQFDDSWGGAIT